MQATVAEMPADQEPAHRWSMPVALGVVGVCWFIGGLAVTRLLYEWRFPDWLLLARPLPILVTAGVLALVLTIGCRRLAPDACGRLAVASLPLLLNVAWLHDPVVNVDRSRYLFAASLWFVALLAVYLVGEVSRRQWRGLGLAFITLALLPTYLLTMSAAVGEADTFEFQVVAPQLGIAHPTGYPLYLLFGKLFALLPISTVAWRVNLASAVFAIAAAGIVFLLGYRLLREPLPAIAAAIVLGLTPVFWSQAIIAEVYTLHALLVAAALWLMVALVDNREPTYADRRKYAVALAFVVGLGLTNHLTTLFLLPPATIALLLYAYDAIKALRRSAVNGPRWVLRLILLMLVAFAVPLLLYTYLPLRWQAVNDEPMGVARFVDWVAGGRFQGALQWSAWLRDPTRRSIVGRLLHDAWSWVYTVLALIGLVYLFLRHWRVALILLVSGVGFTFYALNYYVPDLAVFLIPTHVVVAVLVAAGIVSLIALVNRFLGRTNHGASLAPATASLIFLLAMLPAILRASSLWTVIDQSARDGGETWARVVLSSPLAQGAAILADSEKVAPLYYLQQVEGIRPDLAIMVLPDEAAYRSELDARLAAGQTVYLARFLPGLEGVYHLRSAGPLLEVSREPLHDGPEEAVPSDVVVGPLRLLGYRLESESVDPATAAFTLYWTRDQPLPSGEMPPQLYLRWAEQVSDLPVTGKHAAGNSYPINAWRDAEVVADYHALPVPADACGPALDTCELTLQAAVAPQFTPSDTLVWTSLARVPVTASGAIAGGQPYRAVLADFALDAAAFPAQIRPQTPLVVRYSGYGPSSTPTFTLASPDREGVSVPRFGVVSRLPWGESRAHAVELATDLPPGRYDLLASTELGASLCGWFAAPGAACKLGEVEISGAVLPEGATNFADRISLLDVALPSVRLEPGGQLPLELTWQGLAPMNENYTVFVQVLDAQDRIVGQVDSWPLQGTHPTGGWRPGEIVRDPYVIQLSDDLPPGDYRLNIGLYLLATLQRLPVLDASGAPVGDKVELPLASD